MLVKDGTFLNTKKTSITKKAMEATFKLKDKLLTLVSKAVAKLLVLSGLRKLINNF